MHLDDRRIEELLEALDHPVPPVTADAVAARAGRPSRRPIRWAAAVLLALGAAGGAFALPSSPLRQWVAAVAARWGKGATTAPPAQGRAGDRGSAGIAVAPGRRLLILFPHPTGGAARVAVTERAEVVVRAPAGGATFTSEDARLVIDDRGAPDTFAIEIPRAAPWVEIRTAQARLFLKDGGRVTAAGVADSATVYQIPLPLH